MTPRRPAGADQQRREIDSPDRNTSIGWPAGHQIAVGDGCEREDSRRFHPGTCPYSSAIVACTSRSTPMSRQLPDVAHADIECGQQCATTLAARWLPVYRCGG